MNARLAAAAAALAVTLALAAPLPTAPAADLGEVERAGLSKVAEQWVGLGKWCLGRDLGEQARACAERANAADATVRGADRLSELAAACAAAGEARDLKTWERRHAAVARKVADIYAKLHDALAAAGDAAARERAQGYLERALALDGTPARWKGMLALAQQSAQRKDGLDRAARLAERALALGPPEELGPGFWAVLDAAATDRLVLRTAPGHPMRYWLSLPPGYDRAADREWPVLVCVEGAGSNWKGIAAGYQKRRADLPFIIVSPCTFSNTNAIAGKMREKYAEVYAEETIAEGDRARLAWDEAGLLAVLDDLRARYRAERRVYVTGFSGGGNVTYMMVFAHPDRVAGAAPACANFLDRGYERVAGAFEADERAFPVHQITGEKDPHRELTHGKEGVPGIEPQTDAAERVLRAVGYPNVKRTMVPGLGHSAAMEQVLETFRPYMLGQKKRSDPQ